MLPTAMILQSVLLWHASTRTSPTFDEYAHVTAGLEYWTGGNLRLYDVNPPLVRAWATLPLVIQGVGPPALGFATSHLLHRRPEFKLGRRFADETGTEAFDAVVVARRMCIPIVLLGSLGCWILGCQIGSERVGLAAGVLWGFMPMVLGHGVLVTCDIPAAVAGCWATIAWLNAGRDSRGVLSFLTAGALLGIAILTKFTWLLAIGLLPLCIFVQRDQPQKWPMIEWGTALKITLALAAAWLVVNLGYRWQEVGVPLKDFEFVSASLNKSSERAGNRFSATWAGAIPVPVSRIMLEGMDQQWEDFDEPRSTYLAGNWLEKGPWYYYVCALFVKTPLGLMVLALCSLPNILRSRAAIVSCVLPGLLVFMLVSSRTNMCEHTRYLWIVLPHVLVASCLCLDSKRETIRWIATLAALWAASSGIASFPHGLAYSNELFGGYANSWRMLHGSNTDWGQGWVFAREWAVAHRESTPVAIRATESIDLPALGFEVEAQEPPGFTGDTVILLISVADRMKAQALNQLRWLDPERRELIGSCVEAYHVPIERVLGKDGYVWIKRTNF